MVPASVPQAPTTSDSSRAPQRRPLASTEARAWAVAGSSMTFPEALPR